MSVAAVDHVGTANRTVDPTVSAEDSAWDLGHWLGSIVQYVLTSAFDTSWDMITPENIAQAIGAMAAMLAVLISMTHIVVHWQYNRTKLRKSTVRLLFVVPIFAIDCWACLMVEDSVWQWAELLTCIREIYEAIALVSFMELVLTILGGSQHLAQVLLSDASNKDLYQPPQVQHLWPLCKVLPPYPAGGEFLRCMLSGIFQYVFVCLAYFVMIFLVWECRILGALSPGLLTVAKALPNIMKAVSCAWALNCLVLFAHEVYAHVPRCGLGLKFISIKGIVFFTFWQGFVIGVCQKTGLLKSLRHYIGTRATDQGLDPAFWDQSELRSGLNDFLLCFEVLFFSVLHWFAYPAREIERMPPRIKARIQQDDSPNVERILSVVNLMNISRLVDEVHNLDWRRTVSENSWKDAPTRTASARSLGSGSALLLSTEAACPLLSPRRGA